MAKEVLCFEECSVMNSAFLQCGCSHLLNGGPVTKAVPFSPTIPALRIAGILCYRFYSSALLHSFLVFSASLFYRLEIFDFNTVTFPGS